MKKNNRKNKKLLHILVSRNNEEQAKPSRLWNTIKEFVLPITAGLSGLVVFIVWIGGRYFATGYFLAMNIPIYAVNFSVWEYAETVWRPIAFILLYSIGIASITLGFLEGLTSFIKRKINRGEIDDTSRNSSKESLYIEFGFISIVSICLLVLMQFSFLNLYKFGTASGNYEVFNAQSVEIVSQSPLGISNPIVSTKDNFPNYTYKNLRLLIHNNGKYYLFDEIDNSTCAPKTVYIVQDSQMSEISLGTRVHATESSCKFSIRTIFLIYPYVESGPTYSQ